jgi:D-proline reductase (dithiol) PrdB
VVVQRIIEQAGIPTIIISALPPVTRQNGAPRAVAPLVPMGANAGAPHDKAMQRGILKEALKHLVEIQVVGTTVPLPYQYTAQI